MNRKSKRILTSSVLLAGLFSQTLLLSAQQTTNPPTFHVALQNENETQAVKGLLEQARGAEVPVLFERLFGDEAAAAADVLIGGSEQLIEAVSTAAGEKAGAHLDAQIEERTAKKKAPTVVAPKIKAGPATKPAQKNPATKPLKKAPAKSNRLGFIHQQQSFWQPVAFTLQLVNQPQQAPEIKMTESDKEIKAEGSDKKSFETNDAKGTRTQKVETRYTKDGTTFGVEIKDTQVIEAVSKPDGKRFRRELSLLWGADVAACPDVNGVTAGTGKAKVISKTTYTEAGDTVTMTSQFDLQAKLTGHVNDKAEMTHYDLVLDAYTENSGYEAALERNLIKEIKIKDGRYGLHYDIPGNTIEISDGKYGGQRTPAKMGKATASLLTPMNDADIKLVGSAIGPMVPSIWNSANEMYVAAQKSWRNSGCVEVSCTVPKLVLEPGEEIEISTETVHLQDRQKVNAQINAEAYGGQITPETQRATPGAKFTFTRDGDEYVSFGAESVSKRGIGKGEVDFKKEKESEEPAEAGAWTGTINAERKHREDREKRSGANLAENGGYLETTTDVQLQLTGRLDRSVEATNAHVATVSGEQEQVDYEYDKYKVDEGHCGPNAVPYKGPKEITRTSRTKVDYNKQTRVYVEIGGTEGTLTFSLPEQTGTTIHSYIHQSPCAEHDRANTNEAIDRDVTGVGGSFSVSFPVDPAQKTVKGTKTVREEDGSTTTYTWELRRHQIP